MNKISISPEIKEKCPNLILGCFSCDLTWAANSDALNEAIETTCKELTKTLTRPEISQIDTIASSRVAYKALGKDPSRYRLSAEALLRRVVTGKALYQINTIVDTLNLISIQTGYSIGGYDLDKIEGDIVLGIGAKEEAYEGIGKGALNVEHLPIFRDDKGAFGTPTSDSTRTMVTENTSSFLMIFLNFGKHSSLNEVLEKTSDLYQKFTNAEIARPLLLTNSMKPFFFSVFFFLLSFGASAQLDFAKGFGGQIGFSFNLGSHFNRIGLIAKLYYHYEHIQANVQLAGYYNPRSFATGIPSWEGQLRVGIVGTFGAKDSIHYSPFINDISNQTSRPYSIGYSYNFYFDNIETSQVSGSFGFGIHGFSFLIENDFLAFSNEDKYRSGAVGLYYRIKNTQISIKNIAWTADPYGPGSITMKSKKFPAKYGYRKTKNALYEGSTAGVLSVGVEQYLGFGQYLGAAIGVDADQIRNAFQNLFVHDSFLLKNPHVPMVDTKGKQYLYEEGQEVRAAKFFFQIEGNNTALY